MAKKSRRARRKQTTRRPSAPPPTKAAQTPQPSVTPDEESPPAEAMAPGKTVDFSAEYAYVIGDLRSMGIIAVLMLAVLIALSLAIG